MIRISRIFTALFLSVTSFTAFSAPALPVVEILGNNYYVYTAKKGDSLFGISRDNGWDYTMLQKLNPKAVSPLGKGTKVYYPVSEGVAQSQEVLPATEYAVASPVSHVVRRGETVYGISKMYKIPVETIYALNPASKTGIKEGEILMLQTPESVNDSENVPEYYTIKKGDTLYGVAKANSTTVAALLRQNPGVSESNFQAGSVIRLPEKGAGVKTVKRTVEEERLSSFSTYKVEKKDTWDTIAEKTGVDKEDLVNANKEHGARPKNKSIVTVPEINRVSVEREIVEEDPRELTEDGIAEIYDDVHGISGAEEEDGIKAVLLLSEPSARKDLEFSRGFLSGIDCLKNSGLGISLTVMDGNRTSEEVLTRLSDIDPDILFLTTEKGIPTYLSEYAEVSQTPMVNTFDVRNELYTRNPYVVQLLTPSNYFNEEIAARIKKDFGEHILLFAGEPEEGDQLANAVAGLWDKKNIKHVTVDEISQYPFSESLKYIVYGSPAKKDEVEVLLDRLEEAKSLNPLAEVSVVGRPSWIVYDENLEDKYHKSDVMIPSRFYYDRRSAESRRFVTHYQSLFDREPAKSFPMYAGVGYDAAMYFMPGLAKAGKDVNMMGSSKPGAQSEFELFRPGNWTGLMNPVVYLVRFTPFNTVDKISVR